jgi:two-component system chemotaxis response regulator CheY
MSAKVGIDIRALIVDDSNSFRIQLTKQLSNLGYKTIVGAGNGKEALQLLQDAWQKKAPFDLIISDWNMPEMTGIELLKQVRAMPELKFTSFLMLTAEGEMDRVVQAIHAGADEYVIKPTTEEILREKLNAVSRKRIAA